MKKQLLTIALLAAGLSFNAQTFFSENFTSATPPGLPAGWSQNNVDGLTPSTNAVIAGFNFGTNAGVTRDITAAFGYPAQYGKSLITMSAYSVAGTSNDWIISPQFTTTVPANGCLSWEARSADPVQQESYEIRVSTTGTLVSDFLANPVLYSAAPETYTPGGFNTHGVSLAAYVGQTIRIAIHDMSNNKWTAYYDNFVGSVPANATDGAVLVINGLPRYKIGAGNTPISGTFKQFGYANATTAVLNYQVNASSVVTETITFSPAVGYYGTQNFTMTAPANLVAGTNTISLWVSHVNGVAETVTSNNTATATVYVASQGRPRNSLVEEWSSSTCNPCASLNVSFDPMLNGNNPNTGGTTNVVKYQVNWPSPYNDPSYNADGANRVTFYGINAAPTAKVDGTLTMSAHSQAEINSAQAVQALADISASITAVGNNLTANASFTPYVGIPSNSPLRVYQVLAQKSYSFANPSTSQTQFYHVMRKMFPSGTGQAITTVDGTPQTVNFNHTATYQTIITSPMTASNTANFWTAATQTFEYIVWIQDAVSGHILQSGSANAQLTTGIVELKDEAKIGVYPNPAKDHATIAIKLNNASMVDIMIMDVTGKVVYTNKGAQVAPGQNEINIVTSEIANGTYNVVVTTEEGTLTDKLIINK